jgi:hypothetical protein
LRTIPNRLERLREGMVALGADTEEIGESRILLEDSGRTISSPTTFVARARRLASA